MQIERLGFDLRGPWRVSRLNFEYSLSPSYPRLLLLPSCINDEALEAVARFRSARRVPAVVWRYVIFCSVLLNLFLLFKNLITVI